MKYRRMPIEIESPEQLGYGNIRCNLTESSVSDMCLEQLNIDLDLRRLVLAYTNHVGKPELRELLAADGAGLKAEDVLVTPSAASALFIISTSLLTARDHLVVIRPNYATNIETPRAIGCAVSYLDLDFEDGFRFSIEKLAGLIRPETRLISLTHPHNPTGAVLTAEQLQAAAELADAHNCYLLVDETYREMNFAGPTPLAASLGRRCISVASMSKSFGLPGIRIGWLVTRDPELQELFLAAKEQMFICNSIVDEEIAYRVLAQKQRILPRILARNRLAFETVRTWMGQQKYMEWVEPGGGVVCFPRIKPDSGVDVEAFYRILNGKYATYTGPGHWFERERRFMRVGYGWPSAPELSEGLNNLSLAMEEARGE